VGTAEMQGALWGARAEDFAEANEPGWRAVFDAALAHAGIHRGTRHLDIGCGAGGALVASRALGADVAGLDASANLVAIARRRLPRARIEVGEMEAQPFGDGSFDVVTAINSVQFAGDPVRALDEARRVTRPDGAVLILVWGRREDCELISITASAVFALLPPSPQGAAPPRPWAEPGVIENLMREAGLVPVEDGEFPGALEFPDAATATRAVLSASARAIAHAGIEAVTDVIAATLPKVTRRDGAVVWNNRFRWVKASAG
jgi:SAM-dependent methyltransferase